MSKKKYEKGHMIHTIWQFDRCEKTFYIWRRKTIHKSFLESLQYRTLKSIIDNGDLYEAKFIDSKEKGEING